MKTRIGSGWLAVTAALFLAACSGDDFQGECKRDADCGNPGEWRCGANFVCLCQTDAVCEADEYCNASGFCQKHQGCLEDGDCGDPADFRCDTSTGRGLCLCRTDRALDQDIKDKIGIGGGEKTSDELFSLELVECLGSCGTAPVMRMDERYFENLTEDKLDRIIQACRDGRDPVEEDK